MSRRRRPQRPWSVRPRRPLQRTTTPGRWHRSPPPRPRASWPGRPAPRSADGAVTDVRPEAPTETNPTRLYLIRHGETDWNVEGRYQGQIDSTLSARGRAQTERLAEALAAVPFRAVYSSPLSRSR